MWRSCGDRVGTAAALPAPSPGRAILGVMGSVVAPVLLALVVALAVLAVSAVVSAGRPVRALLRDGQEALRDGLRRERWSSVPERPERPAPRRTALLVGAVGEDDDEDGGSVMDLFEIGRPAQDDYLRADRLAAAIERAQGAVVGGVQHVQHRVRR